MKKTSPENANYNFSQSTNDILLIQLAGTWHIGQQLPSLGQVRDRIKGQGTIKHIAFESESLKSWDSSILLFLDRIIKTSKEKGVEIIQEGIPQNIRTLLDLAAAVPKKEDARKTVSRDPFLARVGSDFISFLQSAGELLGFVGEAFMAVVRLITGKAKFRSSDLALFLQSSGAEAVPIIALICFLVGLILAFVGIVQLKMFGAEVYVANLVGIAMVRAMGAIMAGIIMAGRTGAAYAAQLGTMQVNEEIDALQTLGLNPMDFLVLPRMLALTLMMPLLCLFADLMGILGGWLVAVPLYGLNSTQYFANTMNAIGLNDFFIGLFQSLVFGVLVALSGCLRGMQCGRSASAVGDAATSAVVTGIVAIIVATAVITIACDVLGI